MQTHVKVLFQLPTMRSIIPALPEFANSSCAAGTRRSLPGRRRILRRRWPTAATRTAKTAFAVCHSTVTRQTYSPCVCAGTRRTKVSRRREVLLTVRLMVLGDVRRAPRHMARGEDLGFAVCLEGRHTANMVVGPGM